ncbi:hypothetical protein B0H13DRAFT_1858158 [Mycena leptocephala]|nr:hypothetical protein B0H13DRAFT_1858158 [Mycena leptocephala]
MSSSPQRISCELCNRVFASPGDYALHLATKQHLNKVQGESGAVLHCSVCQKYVSGMKNWVQHIAGARHAAVAAETGRQPDVPPEEPEYVPGHTLCSTCNSHIPDRNWPRHHLTAKHKDREQFVFFQTALDEAERDKNVTLRQDHNGRAEDRLEILFEDVQLRRHFIIARILRVIVGNRGDHEMFRPTVPYVPRKRSDPKQLGFNAVDGEHDEHRDQHSPTVSTTCLDSKTYARHFKHLLWIEEFRMERDLEHYDISHARLTANNYYHFLDVPGLAEKRPSVLVYPGDRILVQKHGSAQGHWFEGGVHVVRKEEVGLKFNAAFRATSLADRFNVRFKLNRYPLRRQHLAWIRRTQRITRYGQDRDNGRSHPPGPHGQPHARILACAPSNSAADLIASRLMALSTDELFRFYAPSRNKDQVALELREYTYAKPDGHFSVPPLARMKRFRVVVTTCVSASVVSGIGIPRGHYTHIFCDEAGQATEPEVMIANRLILCSDQDDGGQQHEHHPLGRSQAARAHHPLGSGARAWARNKLHERLMKREIYDEKKVMAPQSVPSVVKLTKNFRSHNAILKFPNERFYGGELQQCADNDIGVITPYHAQCLKIRAVLRAVADGVKVGSVEEFQGQERRVIIISTVRSSREFVEYDLRHTLGFVANPRRFNVAVTRAQALLIVIGDPDVLSLDPLWRSFLNYIYTNGGWTALTFRGTRFCQWTRQRNTMKSYGWERSGI